MASKHILQRIDSNSDLISAKKPKEDVKSVDTASSSDDDTGACSRKLSRYTQINSRRPSQVLARLESKMG